jgi:hypothetical protein
MQNQLTVSDFHLSVPFKIDSVSNPPAAEIMSVEKGPNGWIRINAL